MTAIPISSIRRDGGTQPRDHISIDVAREYAESIAEGAQLPPVTLFYDGADYWLADGFHRVEAHALLNQQDIEADVRQGTRRDAILFSVGANADHGYRRTNLDKRRAVVTLLNDPEWASWSDNEIARRCHVSHPLVAKLRPPVTCNISSQPTRTYLDRHGNTSVMKTSAIGKKPLPLVAGRAPDHRPDPNMGRSEDCGIAEATRITGIKADKLAAIARTGEIEGAAKEGGSWCFKTESLRQWMASKPSEPQKGSRQLREFLGRIRGGEDIASAASAAGIGDGEAKLHAEAEANGEYADIAATAPEQPVEPERPDPLVCPSTGVPLLLATTDMFAQVSRWPPVDRVLTEWEGDIGAGIPLDHIATAAAWIAAFSAQYPEVERRRQIMVADTLQRIEDDVVA